MTAGDAPLSGRASVVVLLTDFGDDYYVGVMKGVIARLAPRSPILDLTHRIRPGAVAEASHVLAAAFRHFPEDAVFCCVVDPGVGGARRKLLVESPAGRRFVGPDNGLFFGVLAEEPGSEAFALLRPADANEPESATFQGRSDFAPAAARLAVGDDRALRGARVTDPVRFADRAALGDDGVLRSEIVYADAFGNLITGITEAELSSAFGAERAALRIEAGAESFGGVVRTFGDRAPGERLAYIGSAGRLELAVRDGSAAARFSIGPGIPVSVRRS